MSERRSYAGTSSWIAEAVGRPWAFACAALAVGGWAISGPLLHFSDTWQLIMNTLSSVVTFLMVFLIQNAQNRDSKALHAKLDALLAAAPSEISRPQATGSGAG